MSDKRTSVLFLFGFTRLLLQHVAPIYYDRISGDSDLRRHAKSNRSRQEAGSWRNAVILCRSFKSYLLPSFGAAYRDINSSLLYNQNLQILPAWNVFFGSSFCACQCLQPKLYLPTSHPGLLVYSSAKGPGYLFSSLTLYLQTSACSSCDCVADRMHLWFSVWGMCMRECVHCVVFVVREKEEKGKVRGNPIAVLVVNDLYNKCIPFLRAGRDKQFSQSVAMKQT